MAFAKKTWKDRIAEFPTRRRLTKEDNTSELVTVAREEGTLSQEGDAFSAENMNDLENRIDEEFTAVNGRLTQVEDRVEPCEIGNVYNFPTTDGATYVAPTDGYIFVQGGGTINILNTYSRITSTVDSDNTTFIRKGMRLKRSGSSGFCRFISLA